MPVDIGEDDDGSDLEIAYVKFSDQGYRSLYGVSLKHAFEGKTDFYEVEHRSGAAKSINRSMDSDSRKLHRTTEQHLVQVKGVSFTLLEITGNEGAVQVNGKVYSKDSSIHLIEGEEVVFNSSGAIVCAIE